MTAFPTYSTGTVSIGANATAVVGTGPNWSGQNAIPGDLLVVAGNTVIVQDVTDALHLVIDSWPYAAVTAGTAYKLYKVSPLRYAGGQAMAAVDTMVAALNTSGFYVFVGPTETVPDPSLGDDEQYALQATTGKLWQKTGGAWNFIGIQKGISLPVPWNSATAYNPFDAVSLAGTSYVCILANTNQAPPNATYWTVLAAKGDQGIQGASYAATSTTTENLAALGSTANLLLWSEDLTNGVWGFALASGAANVTTAPDGSSTADKIVEDTTATNIHAVFQTVTTVNATPYTLSFFAKASTRSKIQAQLDDGSIGWADATFDLSAGTVSGAFASITALPNGWYQCTLSGTSTSTTTRLVLFLNNGTSITYTGDGASGVYLWGAQLTPGTGNFGYIKTTSAAASGLSLTTQAGLAYQTGTRVRVASTATPADYFEMLVTQYAGSILTGAVVKIAGSGTFSNWTLGLTGDAGLGYGGSSATSLAIGTGSQTFTGVYKYLAYQVGNYVRAASAASGVNFMEGNVTAYADGVLTINVTKTGGSGTHADWNFSIAGAPGAGDLLSTNNLSDVASSSIALSNLGAVSKPQCRATLTTGTPETTADVVAATTIYCTPSGGNLIPIWNATTGKFVPISFAEMSLALDSNTSHVGAQLASCNFDTFAFLNSGAIAFGSGPYWSKTATVTITNASPGVINWTGHALLFDTPVVFSTTGTLPTGLTPGVTYFVSGSSLLTNSFIVSATQGGVAINTTGAGSGVHTATAGADTGRGTGAGTTELELVNGIWVNKNATTLRFGLSAGNTISVAARQATFIATFRTIDTANGQTEDSQVHRYLSNAWNDVERPMAVLGATGTTWTYSTATLRQANANVANRLDYVCCFARSTWASVMVNVNNSTATLRYVGVGIGVDSTVAQSALLANLSSITNVTYSAPQAYYAGTPGLGRHILTWLEFGGGADTQTWFGHGVATGIETSGIVGSVRG